MKSLINSSPVKRSLMKRTVFSFTAVSFIAAASAVSPALALQAQAQVQPGAQTAEAPAASAVRTVCARGADERIIEILSPGEIGARCDVRYIRGGGAEVRTPYHANNAADFCTDKAASLAATLREAGFACSGPAVAAAPALRDPQEAAPAAEATPASDFVIETQRAAPEQPTAPEPGEGGAPIEDDREAAAPEEDRLAALMNEILSQSVSDDTVGDASGEVSGGALVDAASGEGSLDGGAEGGAGGGRLAEPGAPLSAPVSVPVSASISAPVSAPVSANDPVIASRGPADLTAGVAALSETPSIGTGREESASEAPAASSLETSPVDASAALGRLVGAEPTAPASADATEAVPALSATEISSAAITAIPLDDLPPPEAAPASAAAPSRPVDAAPADAPRADRRIAQPVRAAAIPAAAPTNGVPTLLRRPADIVRATVKAQAAAWNEGNLDAFMDVYARDDALIYVSGAEMTRGWSAARKRYRERFDGPAQMGRIDFENLDAELVTEDVAIVTGRIRHAIGEEISKAVFSLVMKREQGVWRIVHDHSAPVIAAAQ